MIDWAATFGLIIAFAGGVCVGAVIVAHRQIHGWRTP